VRKTWRWACSSLETAGKARLREGVHTITLREREKIDPDLIVALHKLHQKCAACHHETYKAGAYSATVLRRSITGDLGPEIADLSLAG
jgi:hypothetical protein